MITVYRTQSLSFTVFDSRHQHGYQFKLTFNSPDGDIDVKEAYYACSQQITAAGVITDDMDERQLFVIADWLAQALFNSQGRGVSVEVMKDHQFGASATYGNMEPVEVVDGEEVPDDE